MADTTDVIERRNAAALASYSEAEDPHWYEEEISDDEWESQIVTEAMDMVCGRIPMRPRAEHLESLISRIERLEKDIAQIWRSI